MSETTTPTVESEVSEVETTPASEAPAPIVVNGLKIEVGIPVPDFQAGRGTGSKFDPVFAALPAGGSIFFGGENADRQVGSLLRVAKKRGLRFITRKVVEDGVKGIRVWRRENP